MSRYIQIGVIGAMQRAHPALTQLWCQWTGLPGMANVAFNLSPAKHGPATLISVPSGTEAKASWAALSDLCALPADAPQRRQMPMAFAARDPAHGAFWQALKQREMQGVDGPLEWWWRLLILRCGGLNRASRVLSRIAIGSEPELDHALVYFENPSLSPQAKNVQELLVTKRYSQPTKLVLVFNKQSHEKHSSLAFTLSDATFKARLVSGLIDLAVRVEP
jgi:hypothetical protein